nr:hypothetical protein [uncultured Chryseobacterium sp.]
MKNAKTKTLLTDLKGKTTSATAEHGYLLEESNGVISETHIEGIPGTGEINFNVNAAIDGYIHSHYQGLLSVFSPSDLFALAQIYKKGMIKNTNTFAIGVVTASGTQYMMVIDDLTKFDNFINTLFTGNEIDPNIANLYETSYNILQINNTNSVANNESNFLTFLEQNNLGLKMLKGDSTFNSWSLLTKNSEGTVVPQNCN